MTHPPVRQRVEPGQLPRHRHPEPYVAVVLAGSYEEAGDSGRRRLGPGDVVVHMAWEAHLNRTPGSGAQVLNLPPPPGQLSPFGRVRDLTGLLRAAERTPAEAAERLQAEFQPAPHRLADWPDLLAAALAEGDRQSLASWAERLGLSPERVSRGFGQAFGVTPQRFRWEARNRAALSDLAAGSAPLAELAVAHGFADQAHLTRCIRAFTGRTPGVWRRSNPFKTDR